MNIFAHATYVGTTGYNSHCQNFFRNLNKYHRVKIRNFTIGKNWSFSNIFSENPHVDDIEEQDKKLLGMQSLWSENNQLKDYEIHGFKKSTFNHDLNIVLAEVNHHYFYQDYQGPKIAYTVWENTAYPDYFFDKLKEYDQVWVPSKWQADITIKQGIPAQKVKVIPEGVDGNLFYPRSEKISDDVFRFVLFGRWDARKSTKEIIQAFKNVFGDKDNVELWISVDNGYAVDGMKTTEERLAKHRLECKNIKILHFPSREDYVDILNNSHVFVSCARSEGWNLPLIEAMACGIPSIYSNCSGQLEFAAGKGIPVDISHEVSPKEIRDSYCEMTEIASGNWYEPNFKDLEDKLLYSYNNYSKLKKKALKDSELIRSEFTWDNAAKKAAYAMSNFAAEYYKDDYKVNLLKIHDDKKRVDYSITAKNGKRITVEIVDEFSGLSFYRENLFVSNQCLYFSTHAYILPNQIFKIYDYYSKKLKLEKKINVELTYNLKDLKKENENIVSLMPQSFKNVPAVGFSFLEIFHRKTYEFDKCKINEGDVVFDLGSCFGLFSRYAFLNGASEVHAFEANPELAESNLNLNKNKNLFFTNKPIHSKSVKFSEKEDFIGSQVIEDESSTNSSVNINEYIEKNNISKIDYLKIDIEGSEYDFFKTIDKSFLRKNVKKIALEFHDNTNNKIQEIIDVLNECNFIYKFEYENNRYQDVGMLYAWKANGFNFNAFFEKYREKIAKSGISRLRFYEYIIPKLVEKNKPLHILETGTMWAPLEENMGAFTLIMADLIKNHTGGRIYTVDISEKSIDLCKKHTKEFADSIEYVLSDSIAYLKGLSDEFVFNLDLIYLDSFDFNVPLPHDSANHNLKELLSIFYRMNHNCSIAIDDNFLPNTYVIWHRYDDNGNIVAKERYESGDKILGKAMYSHKFLTEHGWKRFESFDKHGDNNLFFYEKQKLAAGEINKILNNFYSKNSNTVVLPNPPDYLKNVQNIMNSTSGLGDALILTPLMASKNVFSNFEDFGGLCSILGYKSEPSSEWFDILNSDLHKYNWGGGHCIQRLQKAFLGKHDAVPKPYLNKNYAPQKNKVAVHFESSKRKQTALSVSEQEAIFDFLLKNNYEIYCCCFAKNTEELINQMSTCEYFIGIDSGPMHVAAAFGIKSIIIINGQDAKNIYLPKLAEVPVANSEWLYPQNVHLSTGEGNELVEKFSINNLRNAMAGNLYPYFSLDFIESKHDFKWNFEEKDNKLNFCFGKDYDGARIILKELNKNLKCFDWEIGKITKDINYYIVPTSNVKLMDIDFEGFVFSLYVNDLLVFEKNLIVKNIEIKSKTKYFSSKEIDLSIKDSFYLQYSDFYANSFIKNCVKNKNVVVDVGASCGSFVDVCLQNEVSKVVALEPSRSFEILSNTFEGNSKVIYINKALSTNCDTKEIYTTDHTTLSSFEMEKQKAFDSDNLIKETSLTKIECIDLSSLKKNFNLSQIDLLKIDIEGYEYELFSSLSKNDLENINQILLEYHHNQNNKIGLITQKLKAFGFDVNLMNLSYKKDESIDNLQGVIHAKRPETIKNIINESGSLGDFLSWVPAVSQYANLKNTKVNFYSPHKELVQDSYPNINFLDYSLKDTIGAAKSISLGCYDGSDYQEKNLQQIAFDILDIPFKEERCVVSRKYKKTNKFQKKYVCISTQSTCQCKYWNNPGAWEKVVDYLKSLGFDVVCIDRYESFGVSPSMNYIPNNCINKTGDLPLEDRINDIFHCEFLVGLSSGLSWLAWACEKPVVMISGFTDTFNEFSNPYRVINKNVCNSCWNDKSIKFDRNNWFWCPRNKNFECSKEISVESVIKTINKLITEHAIKV